MPDHGYRQMLVRSLIRAQLGLSLLCLALALAVIASFPVLFGVLPSAVRVRIFGLPLTLIVLGIGVFPVMLLIGYFYVRQAERLERRFAELVRHVDRFPADD